MAAPSVTANIGNPAGGGGARPANNSGKSAGTAAPAPTPTPTGTPAPTPIPTVPPADSGEQSGAFPALSGRVVDAANIISPATEAALTARLATLETQTRRQLVVATVPSLGGQDVADYGYLLGRSWGIGNRERNDGVILLIAPNERRMHIAVGYGLEPVLTDALSAQIIRNDITPAFKQVDYDSGITAGDNASARQIMLTPEEAAAAAAAAAEQEQSSGRIGTYIFWGFVILFILLIIFGKRTGSRHHSSRHGSGPIIVWGGSDWGSGGGGSSGWSGGGGFGGGGGGFGGGGGSFGGGGASGGW